MPSENTNLSVEQKVELLLASFHGESASTVLWILHLTQMAVLTQCLTTADAVGLWAQMKEKGDIDIAKVIEHINARNQTQRRQ